ncbi:hypothetical protein [Filomicrobium sp.]|uniref:AbiU2 domain-containing protein n=1 Tax=Filomicrobium sp. TaxID=2024831 RepID=UPI00258F7123|nr:hypothetical protein [Filomicrobium sp.]MCV0368343.1 hypothetical protein [Filomicrobium sp.]
MNDELQKAAVRRCASELSRAIWYYRAWKALQEVERDNSANFIRLAELAMWDQMIAHVVKILSLNPKTGRGEKAGFWALCECRATEVEAICERQGCDLDPIRKVGVGLKHIRDKTHFHLDADGVSEPTEVWKKADITHDQLNAALSSSFTIINELHAIVFGASHPIWNYDGSDAKVIAEHANTYNLLYGGGCGETTRED